MSPTFNDLPVSVVDLISKFLYDQKDVRNALMTNKGFTDSVSRVCKISHVSGFSIPSGFRRLAIDLLVTATDDEGNPFDSIDDMERYIWTPEFDENPFVEENIKNLEYLHITLDDDMVPYFGTPLLMRLFESNFPSLAYLDISNVSTPLVDIDLSGFSAASILTTLIMRNCRVGDLSVIPSLRALTSLDLSYNVFNDHEVNTHLVKMTRLEYLNLRGNIYVTPACFDSLPKTLTFLDISGCTSAGTSFLHGFSAASILTTLIMRNCRIRDLSGIASLSALTFLDLSYNMFNDYQVNTHLVKMTSVTSLNLRNNSGVTPACFESRPNTLTSLDISGTSSGNNDEHGFKELSTTISCLVVDYCHDMYPGDLSHMTSLTSLSMMHNQCIDNDFLASLPSSLESLNIKGCDRAEFTDETKHLEEIIIE